MVHDDICPQLSFSLEGGGVRGRRKEVEEKQARQELGRQMQVLPQVQLNHECRMRGTRENMTVVWVLIHSRGRGG